MDKQTKIAFRIIIIGLIVFIPLSISSLVLKITGFTLVKEEINPNNDMYYNNKKTAKMLLKHAFYAVFFGVIIYFPLLRVIGNRLWYNK